MRKNRVNLLITKADYNRYENFFSRLRIVSLFISFVLLFSTLLIYLTFFKKKADLDSLIKEKNNINKEISAKSQNFTKLNAIIDRYELLGKYLKEDANFLPYYTLLISSLSESTNSAKIEAFKIDKQRNTQFTVSFNNFIELMNFFKLIESKKFLDNFEILSLKKFNLISDSLLIQNYQLVFNGKFKIRHENQF
jgi:type II secretory pathway component PulL